MKRYSKLSSKGCMILMVIRAYYIIDEVWDSISDEAKDLIMSLLAPPEERIGA
jgi:hypothetical protein